MADIKQAAKWMEEGRLVKRPGWFKNFSYKADDAPYPNVVCSDGSDMDEEGLQLRDLLAEDWELADSEPPA